MSAQPRISVRLVSGDGFAFIVSRDVAEQSATIRNMLDMSRSTSQHAAAFTEALTNEIKFPEIRGQVLEKVIQYLTYKRRYSAENEGAAEHIPEFGFDIEMSLELLMAADYLDC
ncbi:elongin C [Coemansia sp. Benny D115]|nr:elongin C [Coemansia sp. Benny D115]